MVMILVFLFILNSAHAQESEQNITSASGYLDSRIGDLSRYLKRSEKIQQRLLRRLKRKEARFEKQLAAKDSAAYLRYKAQGISYDSIARLSTDSNKLKEWAARKNSLTDSLSGISRFIGDQQSKLGQASGLAGKAGVQLPYTDKIGALQGQLNARQSTLQMIQQRTGALESLARNQGIGGLKDIQKQVYYAREKIRAWKQLADDPDAAEEKAMEYLQGTEGFGAYLKSDNNAFGGLGNNATAEDLQRMGFQTKGQVNALLQQKLGANLGKVQQQMSEQIQQYNDKLNGITDKVNEAKSSVQQAKQTVSGARQAAKDAAHIGKPAFTPNPERAKPFWQRLEIQYNFQTSRAAPDGLRPAMLDLGASVAFKHTPRLQYGLGIGLGTGLGQNWQNIRFTYEGLTARAFTDWQWQYGFSVQGGYERSFRPGNRAYLSEQASGFNNPSNSGSNNSILNSIGGGQQQAAYLGVMKRYRIGGKWNGTLLVAYNFLWREAQLRSPLLLRFGMAK